MTLDECAARLDIQHLITSWSVGCDSRKLADWVWADDAVVHAPGGVRIAGKENILGLFSGGRYAYTKRGSDEPITTDKPPVAPARGETGEAPPWLRHNLTTMLITLDGEDAAHGFTYFLVIGNAGPVGSGRYEDRFFKRDGKWRFAERKTRLEYIPQGEKWDAARAIADADRLADKASAISGTP